MMQKMRGPASKVRLAIANIWDRAAAEIKRSAALVANDLHAIGIPIHFIVRDRNRQGCHLCLGILAAARSVSNSSEAGAISGSSPCKLMMASTSSVASNFRDAVRSG